MKKIISDLILEYQKFPDNFFSECDFQYLLYKLLINSDLNKKELSKDGKTINTIHPEYPSVNRIKLLRGKGYRVWYDLAVLNRDFIINNDYRTILARNEKEAKTWGENVSTAIELKYFRKKNINDINLVNQDCFKLNLCKEVKEKYVLIFSEYPLSSPELINKYKGVSLYWITRKDFTII